MASTAVQKLENLLLVAIPRDMTDDDVLNLRREVLQSIRTYQSHFVLLDFSRVDICDSFFGRFIQSTSNMAALMGASIVVAGLQDAVVETMIELGMVLPNIQTVLDLDDALELSRKAEAKYAAMREAVDEESVDSTGEVPPARTDQSFQQAEV